MDSTHRVEKRMQQARPLRIRSWQAKAPKLTSVLLEAKLFMAVDGKGRNLLAGRD